MAVPSADRLLRDWAAMRALRDALLEGPKRFVRSEELEAHTRIDALVRAMADMERGLVASPAHTVSVALGKLNIAMNYAREEGALDLNWRLVESAIRDLEAADAEARAPAPASKPS